MALRFHAQTGGSTLTAQQPENNVVRVAIQALAAVVRRRAVAAHELASTRRSRCPTEHAARIALRTQQIIAARGRDDRHRRPARRLVLHRGADRRARGARVGADRARRRARRRGRGDRAGLRAGRDRAGRLPLAAAGRGGRAGDRRRQPLRRRTSRNAIELQRIDPAAERRQLERTARASGRSGTPRRPRRRSPRCARPRDGDGEPPAPDAGGARAARCTVGEICERPPRGVGDVRRLTVRPGRGPRLTPCAIADPARLADVPGAGRPRPRHVRRAARARARERAGTRSSARCSTARGGGKLRYLELARRTHRGRACPTSSTRTSSSRPGSSRRSRRARRSSSPRTGGTSGTSARSPASRAATRLVVRRAATVIAVSDWLRRELEAKAAGGAREDGGGRLRRRPRAVRRRAGAAGRGATPAFLCVGALTERKNVVRLADAFARLGEGALTFVGDGPLRGRARRPARASASPAASRTTRSRAWLAAADVVCAAEPGRAVRPGDAGGDGVRPPVVATRDRRPARVRAARGRHARRPARRGRARSRRCGGRGALPRPNDAARAAAAGARRQPPGGADGGDSRSSRGRSASLSSTSGRIALLEARLARERERLLLALARLRRVDALLEAVVARDQELLDPLARPRLSQADGNKRECGRCRFAS